MAEKIQFYVKRQSDVQRSHISDEITTNGYDEIFNLIIEFTMMLYMEDKLGQVLENKNIEKKWNDKLTSSANRYLEKLDV